MEGALQSLPGFPATSTQVQAWQRACSATMKTSWPIRVSRQGWKIQCNNNVQGGQHEGEDCTLTMSFWQRCMAHVLGRRGCACAPHRHCCACLCGSPVCACLGSAVVHMPLDQQWCTCLQDRRLNACTRGLR
eukprot:357811-Chlamydomonas_euryale.AAC.20